MKTDNYLSLCLDQAAKSPLHYRHGCIIVRGGKVVGQGFNDYRPGYEGGSLKNGRVANGAFHGPAVADLKTKLEKQKEEQKEKKKQSFVPFEGTAGGHGAKTPLSMHSEMMAIHSALAASSTLSCSAISSQKPCFKLSSGDKRKAQLRRQTLAAYVNAVCETAPRSGQPQAQHNHNNNVQQQQDARCRSDEEDRVQQRLDKAQRVKDKSLSFQAERSGDKHRQKNQNGKKKRGKQAGQDEDQYDRCGQQTQQHLRRQPSVSKIQSGSGIRGYEVTSTKSTGNAVESVTGDWQHDKHKKDYKRSGKMRRERLHEPPQPEPMLLPKGHTASSIRSVTDREKHPRLHGADIYLARLGRCRDPAERRDNPTAISDNSAATADGSLESNTGTEETMAYSSAALGSTATSSSSDYGCLHDELVNRERSPGRTRNCTAAEKVDINTVRASRPCYRCITYMHSVGIKRVFWTNDAGNWEGGKVRDLMDALDNSMENVALKDGSGGMGGPTGNGVFVTKHEVLMLKRMMGRREGK